MKPIPGNPGFEKRWDLGINSDAFGPEGQDDQEKVSWIVIPSVPIEWLNMHENAFIERSNQDLKGYFLDSFQSSLLRQMWFTQAVETLTEPFEINEICSIAKTKAPNSVSFKVVVGLGTIKWNGILGHDFLPNWMIFFHLSTTWLSDLYIIKKLVFLLIHNCWKTEIWFFFSITEPCRDDLKPRFLIKRLYDYIVPSPSTALASFLEIQKKTLRLRLIPFDSIWTFWAISSPYLLLSILMGKQACQINADTEMKYPFWSYKKSI